MKKFINELRYRIHLRRAIIRWKKKTMNYMVAYNNNPTSLNKMLYETSSDLLHKLVQEKESLT